RPDTPTERGASDVETRLSEVLSAYDPIIYERVWSPELVARLRQKLPGKIFIGLRGEHLLLDSAPADVFCDGDPKQVLGALLLWLRGERADPPARVLFRRDPPDDGPAQWQQSEGADAPPARAVRYAPNLRPVIINPEALPTSRTFSIVGNE